MQVVETAQTQVTEASKIQVYKIVNLYRFENLRYTYRTQARLKMIVSCISYKGGVGKTTTAVNLAGYFQQRGSTLLIDGDPNRSVLRRWAKPGRLPFKTLDERGAMLQARDFEHVVIDSQLRPSEIEELHSLASISSYIVIPTTVEVLSLDALLGIVRELRQVEAQYRVLLTMVSPRPTREVDEARALLAQAEIPIFNQAIRRLVAHQKAALNGVLVRDVADPRAHEAAMDYEAVGREILP